MITKKKKGREEDRRKGEKESLWGLNKLAGNILGKFCWKIILVASMWENELLSMTAKNIASRKTRLLHAGTFAGLVLGHLFWGLALGDCRCLSFEFAHHRMKISLDLEDMEWGLIQT